MNQQAFEEKNRPIWQDFETILNGLEKQKKSKDATPDYAQFPQLYRRICQHLALARERRYSTYVIDQLNQLAQRGHQHFYKTDTKTLSHALDFLLFYFPAAVTKEWRLFLFSTAAYFLPLALMAYTTAVNPEIIYTMMEPNEVQEFEQMYSLENNHIGRKRDSDNNFLMFGYYIWNNVSIDFRIFAGGLVLGLGTLFFLVYNGILHGSVMGYLIQNGSGEIFFSFIAGHGAFELVGMIVAGVAGFKLGLAIINPGRIRRGQALKKAAHEGVYLIFGAGFLTLLAAFVEAFWSSNQMFSPLTKYITGLSLLILTLVYLFRSGAHHGSR